MLCVATANAVSWISAVGATRAATGNAGIALSVEEAKRLQALCKGVVCSRRVFDLLPACRGIEVEDYVILAGHIPGGVNTAAETPVELLSDDPADLAGSLPRALDAVRPARLEPFVEDATSWSFDIFDANLLSVADSLLTRHLDVVGRYGVGRAQLSRFLGAVGRLMRPNPYHNLHHAVDTACVALKFAKDLDVSHLDTFALVLAALCHDLDHPGRGNSFLVATNHRLALRYNDTSVLENWHACIMWTVLARPDMDVLQGLSREQRRHVRKLSITAILGTDLARHRDIQRDGLAATLLHAADISNPAKPWPIAKAWSDRLVAEFRAQADDEERHGLRANVPDQRTLSLAFIDNVVLPCYTALAAQHGHVQPCLDQLHANRAQWSAQSSTST